MTTKWIKDATIESFFELASKFGANLPFKRTLSLMRLLGCREIACESSEWQKNCSPLICGERYKSCQDYDNNIKYYQKELLKKTCHRFLFFTNSKELIGYCIIHEDLLNDLDKKVNELYYYLTECVLSNPLPREIKGYAFGNYQTTIPLETKQYKIKGNYFSQQNHNTNCCAQAAIKMVLRGYFQDITCEQINKFANIDHKKQEGNLGFSPQQICDSIKAYSRSKQGSELEPSMLHADSANPSHFLKSVYHAIESKIPVILLLTLPKKSSSDETKGHAVSLVGHSFEMNNWGAYGGGYFSESDIGYLSSFLWCNSFIIQDDNFGPFYQLSSRFLTEYTNFFRAKISFSDCAMVRSPLKGGESSKKIPLSAILIHPKKHSYIHQCGFVEAFGAAILNYYLNELESKGDTPATKDFNLYFYNFFSGKELTDIPGKTNDHQPALILRTILVSKEEYLQSQVGELFQKNKMDEEISLRLPEYFWLIEVSVPELFWINKRKIGEILIDPIIYNEECEKSKPTIESLIYIRLPNFLAFYAGTEKNGDYKFRDAYYESFEYPHQELLKKEKGFLRLTFPNNH